LPLSEQTEFLREVLSRMLRENGFKIRKAKDPIPKTGTLVVIGVAPYSGADLGLLDAILEGFALGKAQRSEIEVFDVLSCQQMSDLSEYIPGIGNAYQTPIVGIWKDGVMSECASGAHAHKLLQDRFHLG